MKKQSADNFAHMLVKAMREESSNEIKQQTAFAEMGRVMKYIGSTGEIWIDPDTFDGVLDKEVLHILDGYTPAAGDRVLLVPVTSGAWAVIGKF